MRSRLCIAASVFVVTTILGPITPVRAQSNASIQGEVTDQNGSVISQATIKVYSETTGVEREAITDSGGRYKFVSLPVGNYRLDIQAHGFKTQIIREVHVDVQQIVEQDIRMDVGEISELVSVTSNTVQIEHATISVGQVIDERIVQELPLNGRHFVETALFVPGSVTPPQNGFISQAFRGQGYFGLVSAGNREDTVNFQVNGINLNEQVNNILSFPLPISSLQEFKFDNSTFSAQYGRNSGGIINIGTRHGTNAFHGELFEFFRNDALDARNFFNFTSSHPPPFKRN